MENLKIKEFLAVGSGDGDGYGYGSGDGDGYGDGSGSGSGYGSGSGDGDGYGDGSGSGSGDGYGVLFFDGMPVYDVDGVQTLIFSVYKGFAKGAILLKDLTLRPCYIARGGDKFAHGETLKEAVAALQNKMFAGMPEEDRIDAFYEEHKSGVKYPARDLWVWHNRLTGSCEMGRNAFAEEHGIDVDRDEFTPEEFCTMCRDSYGGATIRKLEARYAEG